MAKKSEKCAAFSGKRSKHKFPSQKVLEYVCPPQVCSPYPNSKNAVLWDTIILIVYIHQDMKGQECDMTHVTLS